MRLPCLPVPGNPGVDFSCPFEFAGKLVQRNRDLGSFQFTLGGQTFRSCTCQGAPGRLQVPVGLLASGVGDAKLLIQIRRFTLRIPGLRLDGLQFVRVVPAVLPLGASKFEATLRRLQLRLHRGDPGLQIVELFRRVLRLLQIVPCLVELSRAFVTCERPFEFFEPVHLRVVTRKLPVEAFPFVTRRFGRGSGLLQRALLASGRRVIPFMVFLHGSQEIASPFTAGDLPDLPRYRLAEGVAGILVQFERRKGVGLKLIHQAAR